MAKLEQQENKKKQTQSHHHHQEEATDEIKTPSQIDGSLRSTTTMTKEPRKITIQAGDGVNVEIPLFATEGSRLLRYAVSSLHDNDDDEEHQEHNNSDDDDNTAASVVIPLNRVHSRELKVVVEFLIHYHEERMIPIVDPLEGVLIGSGDAAIQEVVKPTWAENVPQQRYRDYVDNLGHDMDLLYAVRTAALYMDIRPVR